MDNTLLRTNPHALLCAEDLLTLAPGQPFSALNPVFAQSPAAATLYGVLRPPEDPPVINNSDQVGYFADTGLPKHIRIIADGATDTWSETDYPALANLHDDGAALTNANRLRTVLLVNGQISQRKQSTVALTGGDYRTVNNAGDMEIQAQGAGPADYGNGTVLDIYMLEAGDIVSQVTGIMPTEVECYDFMCANAEPITLIADRV